MNTNDLIQAITLKCETEIANPNGRTAAAGTFADEVLAMIESAGEATAILPRQGLARLRRQRPLVVLDLETTSAQIDQARIIEIAALKIHPDGARESFVTLINPGFDISAEIEELTGIKNEDLEGALPFSHYAEALMDFLRECDLCGFNFRNFDAPVLWEEFYATGRSWPIHQDEILDVMEIFHKMEPRSLTGAISFYCGENHAGAHRALADVEATLKVLDAQLGKYQGLPDDLPTLICETTRDTRLDMAGKIILHNGVPCFGFGKHGPEGGKEPTPCQAQRGYLKWMIEQGSFPGNTKMVVQALLDQGGRNY
jgi:DNA polymerase-3 subunit epsilon